MYAMNGSSGNWYQTAYKNGSAYIYSDYCDVVEMEPSEDERVEPGRGASGMGAITPISLSSSLSAPSAEAHPATVNVVINASAAEAALKKIFIKVPPVCYGFIITEGMHTAQCKNFTSTATAQKFYRL